MFQQNNQNKQRNEAGSVFLISNFNYSLSQLLDVTTMHLLIQQQEVACLVKYSLSPKTFFFS